MKLEMKHIVPYLIYDLPFVCYMAKSNGEDVWDTDNPIYDIVAGVDVMDAGMFGGLIATARENFISGKGDNFRRISDIKLILRPLQEYKNIPEIMDNFSEYHEDQFITSFGFGALNRFDHLSYYMAELMFKNHLDVFQLIKEDLAIDINTINET